MATKFEVGKTYAQCFIGDSELVARFKVISRTAKRVTVLHISRNETITRGVQVYNGDEQFKPFGTYSMCMVVGSEKVEA